MTSSLVGVLDFVSIITVIATIYAFMALGLNLQYGYCGLFNFGVVLFYMVGAYSTIIIYDLLWGSSPLVDSGLPFLSMFPFVILITSVIALFIAKTSFHLRVEYFALVLLGFAEIGKIILENEKWIGGGVFGVDAGLRPFSAFVGLDVYWMVYAMFSFALLLVAYFLVRRIVDSPYGLLLRAIREDEIAVEALGKNSTKAKYSAWILGSILMAIGGILWTPLVTRITPAQFTETVTLSVWVGLLFGGKGNFQGATLGVIAIFTIQRLLQFIPTPTGSPTLIPVMEGIMYGLILIIVLRFRPDGLLPERKIVEHISK